MKKILSIAVAMMMLAAIFGLSLHQTTMHIEKKTPVIARALDFMSPAIAYADSDTTGGKMPEPPPPPIR